MPTSINLPPNGQLTRDDTGPKVFRWTEAMRAWMQSITAAFNSGGGFAPADATYVVKTADATLPNARVATDSATVTLDYATPGQVKWNATGGGTVTTTGSPASGNLTQFSGPTSITNGDLSGDVSTSGTLVTTLANTAVTPGTYGDATHVAQFTVDQKGRLTFAGNVVIIGASADYVVMSNGANPPSPVDDGAGNFVYVGYTP